MCVGGGGRGTERVTVAPDSRKAEQGNKHSFSPCGVGCAQNLFNPGIKRNSASHPFFLTVIKKDCGPWNSRSGLEDTFRDQC